MINPFGFIASLVYFKLAQKYKNIPFLKLFPPIVVSGLCLILTLEIFKIDINLYNASAKYLTLFLIPATIALGYPIYKNINLLKKNKRIIYLAFVIATFVSIAATYAFAVLCKTQLNITESLMPKSVTAPVAIEISKSIGAIPELTACVVVLTGVFGAMFGHKILKLIKVKNDTAIGLAIGCASHIIGTSKCVELKKEKQIVFSSLALVIVGILSAFLIPLFLKIVL